MLYKRQHKISAVNHAQGDATLNPIEQENPTATDNGMMPQEITGRRLQLLWSAGRLLQDVWASASCHLLLMPY